MGFIHFFSVNYLIKKEGWGGGGTRTLKFIRDGASKDTTMKISGKVCSIISPPGLPNTTSKSF
jgi:myosin-1